MWHAARKQEKKVREVMVNYQKRAERRREHYEKLRIDPHQLLRIHGNRCKMHLNPKRSGDQDATMIPWQGDEDNMISRYDVRIHLDYIPDRKKQPPVELSREEKAEESRCNYERYRALVQNLFHGVSEETALKQIDVEEMYPTNKKQKRDGKEKSRAKAAIGFSYSDEGAESSFLEPEDEKERAFSSESEYEIDMDVDEFSSAQVDKLNVLALDYGIPAGTFSKTLRVEKSQLEEQKQARIIDKEKANLSGRKSRKERKQMKEVQTFHRLPTPPSYARRDSPTYEPYEDERRSRSSSRSSSSEPEGQVEFITEFGERSDSEATNEIVATSSHVSSETKSKQSSTNKREDRKRNRSASRERYESSSNRSRHRGRRSPSPRARRRRSRSRDSHSRRYSGRSYSRSPRRRSDHRRRSRSRSRDRYTRRRSRSRTPRRHRRSYSRSPQRYRRSRSRSPYRGKGSDSRGSHRRRSRSHSRGRRSRSYSRSPRRHKRSRSRSPSQSKSRSSRRSRSSSLSKGRTSRRSRSQSSSASSSSHSSSPDVSSKKRRVSCSESRSRSHSHSTSPVHEIVRSQSSVSPEPEKREEPAEKSTPSQVGVAKGKLTPQERLMKRMQAQLNKQFKMDKKNQQKRDKLREAEKMEREELLREQMQKVRDVRDRSDYTYSSKGEMYSDQPSRSPTPPSPVRHGVSKNNKDPSEFYYGRFL